MLVADVCVSCRDQEPGLVPGMALEMPEPPHTHVEIDVPLHAKGEQMISPTSHVPFIQSSDDPSLLYRARKQYVDAYYYNKVYNNVLPLWVSSSLVPPQS